MTILLACLGYASLTLYALFRGHYTALCVIMAIGTVTYALGALYALGYIT